MNRRELFKKLTALAGAAVAAPFVAKAVKPTPDESELVTGWDTAMMRFRPHDETDGEEKGGSLAQNRAENRAEVKRVNTLINLWERALGLCVAPK